MGTNSSMINLVNKRIKHSDLLIWFYFILFFSPKNKDTTAVRRPDVEEKFLLALAFASLTDL